MATTPTMRTRVLNAKVPEQVYWHIRRCAIESRLSIKDFMAEFCKTASPIQRRTDLTTPSSQVPAAEHTESE